MFELASSKKHLHRSVDYFTNRTGKKKKKKKRRVRNGSMERRRKRARSMHSNESRFVSGLTEHWSICEFRDDPSPTRYRFRGLHFSLRSPSNRAAHFSASPSDISRVFLVEATTEPARPSGKKKIVENFLELREDEEEEWPIVSDGTVHVYIRMFLTFALFFLYTGVGVTR